MDEVRKCSTRKLFTILLIYLSLAALGLVAMLAFSSCGAQTSGHGGFS